MSAMNAIRARHSVRSYEHKPVPAEIRARVQEAVDQANRDGGLHIQVIWDEPVVFAGKVKGAENCIALVGRKGDDERLGYYGARILLEIQELGLNSVWVAMSFNKKEAEKRCELAEGESVVNAIAFGYGTTEGKPHVSKPLDKHYTATGEVPDWFRAGMEAAMLAPTAINQQKFVFSLDGDTVTAKAKLGPWSKVDLGIVKYFFEVGSGHKVA